MKNKELNPYGSLIWYPSGEYIWLNDRGWTGFTVEVAYDLINGLKQLKETREMRGGKSDLQFVVVNYSNIL